MPKAPGTAAAACTRMRRVWTSSGEAPAPTVRDAAAAPIEQVTTIGSSHNTDRPACGEGVEPAEPAQPARAVTAARAVDASA